MRILFLTCHLPYPPLSGGRRREHELLARLCCEFEVEVCAITKTLEEDAAAVEAVPWPHDGITLFPAELLQHSAPQVARHGSAAAREWLRLNAGRFDAIHVEGFYLWQHLPQVTPPAILAEQNIEYQLWEQRGDLRASRATRATERGAWTEAEALAAITHEDRAIIATATRRTDVHLVPDGADHRTAVDPGASAPPARPGQVVFVGNFAYEPNVDAALWLAGEIFPAVRERTTATLFLVGNAPPPEILALRCEDIHVTGRVPAIEPWLDAAAVVACPLRIGGGVKVKVLEALRRGRAIVATPNCTAGIPQASRVLRVAAHTQEFAEAVVGLLADRQERERLEREAARCAAMLPTWAMAATSLASAWEQLGLAGERAA